MKSIKPIIFLLVLSITLIPNTTATLYETGRWPYGASEGVSVTGDNMFVTFGMVTRQYNVANPSSPTLIKEFKNVGIKETHGSHYGRYIASNSRVFVVSNEKEGATIVDTTTDARKTITYTRSVNGVAISGNNLILGVSDSIHIVDITNPTNPTEKLLITKPSAGVYTDGKTIVSVYDGKMAAFDYTGKQLFEVSPPQYLSGGVLTSYLNVEFDVAFLNNFIILSDRAGMMYVYDLAGNVLSKYPADNNAYETTALVSTYPSKNQVVVAYHDMGISIIQISPDGRIATLSKQYSYFSDIGGYPRSIVVFKDYFAMTAEYRGVGIISIAGTPTMIWKSDGFGSNTAVKLSKDGNYAFIADDCCFRTIDLVNMRQIGVIDYSARAGSYMAYDKVKNVVYVPVFWGGVVSVDVSNPTSVKKLQQYRKGEYGNDVRLLSNGHLLVAFNAMLVEMDVSNPSNMIELRRSLSLGRTIQTIEVNGNYAYVGSDSDVVIVDLTNMRQVGTVSTPYTVDSIKIVGNKMYVNVYVTGMQIYDVTSPFSPKQIGNTWSPFYQFSPNAMFLMSPQSSIIGANAAVHEVDISGTTPRIMNTYALPGASIGSLDASGDKVLASTYSYGLVLYKTSLPVITPIPTPIVTPAVTPSITPSMTPSITPRITPGTTPIITPAPTQNPIYSIPWRVNTWLGIIGNWFNSVIARMGR